MLLDNMQQQHVSVARQHAAAASKCCQATCSECGQQQLSGDLFAIQGLLSSGSVLSMLEIDKGIHAAREGDHIIHRAVLLKDSLQHCPRQPCIQVAQPQVLAGSCIRQQLLKSADQLLISANSS